MSPELNYGADSEGFERALQQMKQLEAQKAELDAREQQLRGAEEATTGAMVDNSATMARQIELAGQLSASLGRVTETLAAEANMLRANTAAWEQNAVAKASAGGVAARTGAARAVTAAETAPLVVPASAAAPVRAEAAVAAERQAQQAAAEMSAVQAMTMRRAAERGSLAERGVAAPLALPVSAAPAQAERLASTMRSESPVLAAGAQAHTASARNVESLATAQVRANTAMADSVAAYSASSTALSRHGALTTEFLQAFARGDVTLKEFESQMLSTIGKFGGWAVAGTLVYGAFNAIKDLGRGAAETQAGVQHLSLSIPAVTAGPQRQQAEATFRNISDQMNVPIATVTDAMTTMGRVFHNVADAGEAARATLYAVRLGGIRPEEAAHDVTALSQGLGVRDPRQLTDVMNELVSLQSRFGVQMKESLPGLATAAPLVGVAGVSRQQLEGVLGVMTRGGWGGEQAATTLMRSATMMAYRPPSQATLRSLGIPAERGQFGQTVEAVMARAPSLSGGQREEIATALGGPRGAAQWLTLMAHPDQYRQMVGTAQNPPVTAQQQLDRVLSTVGERFHHLGITIESIGSELASSGLLSVVGSVVQVMTALATGVERAVEPISHLSSLVSHIPGPLQTGLGAAALLGGIRYAGRRFVGAETGRAFTQEELEGNPNSVMQSLVAQRRTFIAPDLRNDAERAERARLTAAERLRSSVANAGVAQQGGDQTVIAAAQKDVESATTAYSRAEAKAADAAAQVADNQAVIDVLTNDQISVQERINYALTRMLVRTEGNAATAAAPLGVMSPGARMRLSSEGPVGGGMTASGAMLMTGLAAGGVSQMFEGLPPGTQAGMAAEAAQLENQSVSRSMTMLAGAGAAGGGMNAERMAALERQSQAVSETGVIATMRSLGRGNYGDAARALRGPEGSMGSPFAWMIGAQLAGGVLPGGVGDTVSQVGGSLAMGMMFSQMAGAGLGRGLAGLTGRVISPITSRIPFGAGAAAEEALGRLPGIMARPSFGAGAVGLATGATTPGTTGLLESVLGGAAMGSFGGVPGIIAGGVGGLALHMLAAPSAAPGRPGGLPANVADLQTTIAGGQATTQQYAQWGSQMNELLRQAYTGNETTTDAQQAQQSVQKATQNAAKMIEAFPIITRTGAAGLRQLQETVAAAVTSQAASTDPEAVANQITTGQQAIFKGITEQAAHATRLATTPGGVMSAYRVELQRFQDDRARTVQQPLQDSQDQVDSLYQIIHTSPQANAQALQRARQTLAASLVRVQRGGAPLPVPRGFTGGTPQQLAQAGLSDPNWVRSMEAAHPDLTPQIQQVMALQATAGGSDPRRALSQYSQAVAARNQARTHQVAYDQAQRDQLNTQAEAALQADESLSQQTAQRATARAGGNQLSIANANYQKAISDLEALKAIYAQGGMSKAAFEQHFAELSQVAAQAAQQRVQAQVGQDVIPQQLAASRIPSYQPVQQAQAQVRVDQARLAAYRTRMAQAGQALDPVQVAAYEEQINSGQNAVADAMHSQAQNLISAEEQLAQAQHPNDPMAAGAAQVAAGRSMLAIARTAAERDSAQAMILSGQTAAAEGQRQITALNYQAQQAAAAGNSVQQAEIGVAAAQSALATAIGPMDVAQAHAQLAQATYQLHQALVQREVSIGQLNASMTMDPIKADMANLAGVEAALSKATALGLGADAIRALQQQRNQIHNQLLQDTAQKRQATITFQAEMLQEPLQQALQQMQNLLKWAEKMKLPYSTIQQIQQTVRQWQMGQFTPIGGSATEFNLAPGNIRLPTPYDVIHGLFGRGGVAPHNMPNPAHAVAGDISTQVNVYVANSSDVGKVADALDRALGSQVAARMRAAGVTA